MTYEISGVVSLRGSGVEGAKVVVLEADDNALTNMSLVGVQTTDDTGFWSATITSGKVAFAFSTHEIDDKLFVGSPQAFMTEEES